MPGTRSSRTTDTINPQLLSQVHPLLDLGGCLRSGHKLSCYLVGGNLYALSIIISALPLDKDESTIYSTSQDSFSCALGNLAKQGASQRRKQERPLH